MGNTVQIHPVTFLSVFPLVALVAGRASIVTSAEPWNTIVVEPQLALALLLAVVAPIPPGRALRVLDTVRVSESIYLDFNSRQAHRLLYMVFMLFVVLENLASEALGLVLSSAVR